MSREALYMSAVYGRLFAKATNHVEVLIANVARIAYDAGGSCKEHRGINANWKFWFIIE